MEDDKWWENGWLTLCILIIVIFYIRYTVYICNSLFDKGSNVQLQKHV